MSQEAHDLPVATDDVETQVVGDIQAHGWHVVIVREAAEEKPGPFSSHPPVQAAYEADFTYTVGLVHTFSHPEVILVGSWEHAHPFLNIVGDLVRDGRRFTPGTTSDEVLDGFTVRFDAVGARCRTELLTWADWAVQRRAFEAVQLVFPDTEGRWPEDPEYIGYPQPALVA